MTSERPQHSSLSETENSPEDRAKRLEFLGLSDEDAQALQALWARVAPSEAPMIDAFYSHLHAFPETAAFLRDPQVLERLKVLQRAHLRSLFQGAWTESYFEARRRVGRAHADLGLEPRYFLGAFNFFLQQCIEAAASDLGPEGEVFRRQSKALVKAMFLDVGLTLDAYFAHATRELRSALDMYWRANSELRQFAALASHDLKTPLATVANLCDEAVDEFGGEMPEEAKRLIQAAQERTMRMSRMIDELLNFAVDKEARDLVDEISSSEVLHDAVERVRPVLESSRIELTLPAAMPYVWGNRTGLREAFSNVISNAVKFIDKAHGRIIVSVETTVDAYIFCVSDNGPGIPTEELERIFGPFRRLSRDRARPGHGLGLYFTKALIEEQHGRVWAESELGAGSRFYISLPKVHPASRPSP